MPSVDCTDKLVCAWCPHCTPRCGGYAMQVKKSVSFGLIFAVLTLAAAAALGAVAAGAQTNGVGERFSAVAVDLDRGSATPLQIVIERWTSDADRDRLMNVMLNQGADKLLDALQDAPK